MVAAEGDELLADVTPSIGFPFAAFVVLYNPLHLLAGGQGAVGISALAGVEQGLDAALDAQAARVSWALGGRSLLAVAFVI